MFMVPTKILPTGFSPLFSWTTKLRMARELFNPPRAAAADESVASLVERHYGREMVDRVADPLLSGVYGGEAASLSVRAVLPRFAEMERSSRANPLGLQSLSLRRTLRHRLQLVHHRRPRLRSRRPPVAPTRFRIPRPAQ